MDGFKGIFESLGGFIGTSIGLLLAVGIVVAIVMIIRNAKKPKYEQLKQQAYW